MKKGKEINTCLPIVLSVMPEYTSHSNFCNKLSCETTILKPITHKLWHMIVTNTQQRIILNWKYNLSENNVWLDNNYILNT